jgi:hypothetical protein
VKLIEEAIRSFFIITIDLIEEVRNKKKANSASCLIKKGKLLILDLERNKMFEKV